MTIKAVIFDVDGTIADTEREGHLPACNEAFKEMGLGIYWTWKEFIELLNKIPGNANRLKHVLQTEYNKYTEEYIENIVNRFARVKKNIYINKYAAHVPLRKGVVELIHKTLEKDIRLAIVTTSHESQVHALLSNQLGKLHKHFDPILGKESGIKTGEEGMLYEKCLDLIQKNPEECIVIEDSESGMKAALKAKIPTLVCYNEYTQRENFEGAFLVTDCLSKLNLTDLLNGKYNLETKEKRT